jgi:ferredoxin
MFIIEQEGFTQLLVVLQKRGYSLIGPTIRDSTIVYDQINSSAELPKGWTDHQAPASYTLTHTTDDAFFKFVLGPHSWKKFLFPPKIKLFSAHRSGKAFKIDAEPGSTESERKYAFIGVRSCELHALAIQDQVFTKGAYVDRTYSSLRSRTFIVAVNCTQAGGNCFCASMGTGPRVDKGFDLALTEMIGDGTHAFALEVGSEAGARVLEEIPHRSAEQADRDSVGILMEATTANMGKVMQTEGIGELLFENLDHPEWDDVAKRCLTCANCTMVCPTCFCSTVEDVTDLTGDHAERWRRWDSCFTMDFAKVAGGNFRVSAKSRYRQWLTHKLASWIDQFGTSGCVGCGRCITWCPVGIDLTKEVAAIRTKKETTH